MKNLKLFILVLVVLCLAGLVLAESEEDYLEQGVEASKNGQYDQAIADFTKALKLNPKYVEAYLNRGVDHADKSQHDQAIADYNNALEIKSNYLFHRASLLK